MGKEHFYKSDLRWTGNKGEGTRSYTSYDRDFEVEISNKPVFHGSSDASFRGDPSKYNPEDLLVISLSSCHMLWYLHLCAVNGVIVLNYEDKSTGTMVEDENGGRFTEVTLYPNVTVKEENMIDLANQLHQEAHEKCFIANSVNFPVKVEGSSFSA